MQIWKSLTHIVTSHSNCLTPLWLKIMKSSLLRYWSTGYGLPFSFRKRAFSSAVNSLTFRELSLTESVLLSIEGNTADTNTYSSLSKVLKQASMTASMRNTAFSTLRIWLFSEQDCGQTFPRETPSTCGLGGLSPHSLHKRTLVPNECVRNHSSQGAFLTQVILRVSQCCHIAACHLAWAAGWNYVKCQRTVCVRILCPPCVLARVLCVTDSSVTS